MVLRDKFYTQNVLLQKKKTKKNERPIKSTYMKFSEILLKRSNIKAGKFSKVSGKKGY